MSERMVCEHSYTAACDGCRLAVTEQAIERRMMVRIRNEKQLRDALWEIEMNARACASLLRNDELTEERLLEIVEMARSAREAAS